VRLSAPRQLIYISMKRMKLFSKIRSKPLKIIFVTTEAEPFVAAGGLGVVMHALPKALQELGHDVRIIIPRYLQIDSAKWNLQVEYEGLQVPTENRKGVKNLICNVKRYDPVGSAVSVTAYFLENMEYYEQRANVYGYADDAARWVLLCRGALEFLRLSEWSPDVIVCTDRHTGLLPNILKTFYSDDSKLSQITVIHSIHNLGHQLSGLDYRFVAKEELDDGHSLLPALEDPALLKINGMKRGIMYADAINTVSQNYAKEITTSQYGEGLDDLLRRKLEQRRLVGILNGLDYTIWDPEKDQLIKYPFSAKNLPARARNKAELQKYFKLPFGQDFFVAAIVARMIAQKGVDLLESIIFTVLQDLPMQLVVVGVGESRIMEFLLNLKKVFPRQVGTSFVHDPRLPHSIFAGADVALIPSRFEPSGLTQMEAMSYGCIPIVRKTGGLADTVEDYDPEKNQGTGFIFENVDSLSLMIAVVRAYQSFRHKGHWQNLQLRAMQKDFSWKNSARQYVKLFKRAIKLHRLPR